MNDDAQAIVIEFCAAWDRSDSEAVLSYLTPDIVYQNVPLPKMHGKEEAGKFLLPLLKMAQKIEFRLLSIAVSPAGDEVLTERVDRLHFSKGVVDIPLMGFFKVRQGKIAEWRDYADNASTMAAFTSVGINLTAAP